MTRPDFTITADDARALAASARVCGRPMLRRVHDRQTGREEVVPIPCGSTREAVCPACARKARNIRIQQCTEGWHLTDEPDRPSRANSNDGEDQDDDEDQDDEAGPGSKRVRSTKRRQNLPDLPKLKMSHRTVGQVFTTPAGKQYRPSMFATCTLPSYGPVLISGAPKHPGSYDYRRAALDALHFSKLCGRLWSNLRRCAGFNVQYFSVIEAQKRGAPHLHATIRGAIPRAIFRQVVAATDFALWWPPFDVPVYDDRLPEWTGPEHGYVDPDTGEVLPTWAEALDRIDSDPDAKPAHLMRFGTQLDLQGVIPEHADQAVRYLAKYLTKATEDFGLPAQVRSAAHARANGASAHAVRIVAAAEHLATQGDDYSLVLSHLGTLGYRGHPITKSRAYSVTFTQIRRARRRYRTNPAGLAPDADIRELLDDDHDVPDGFELASSWEFAGVGYLDLDQAAAAVMAAARARTR